MEKNLDVSINLLQGSVEILHDDETRIATLDDTLVRGEIVETGDDGYVRFTIGQYVTIGMAEQTTLTLKRITSDDLQILVTHGRIIVEQTGSAPVHIQTNFTDTTLEDGAITLVNYDFLETVMIAPYSSATASIKTSLGSTPLTSAFTIHETPEVTVESSSPTFAFPFYDWYQLRSLE